MNKQDLPICQSCAMPMADPDLQGTNADGSKNSEYCTYCYKEGKFTADITMEAMIDFCVPLTSNNNPWPDATTARQAMRELFPKLKRWQNKG
jgi:putative hemolysin